MSEPVTDRRMAENQVVFRGFNKELLKWQDQFKNLADDEGQLPKEFNADMPLYFYCECSDENCRKRIKISPNAYTKIHKVKNTFTIICGHEVIKIEDVTNKESEYCVVTKHFHPPQSADKLNPTKVDNK